MRGHATKKLHKTISCSHFAHLNAKMMQIPSSANEKWAMALLSLAFLFSFPIARRALMGIKIPIPLFILRTLPSMMVKGCDTFWRMHH